MIEISCSECMGTNAECTRCGGTVQKERDAFRTAIQAARAQALEELADLPCIACAQLSGHAEPCVRGPVSRVLDILNRAIWSGSKATPAPTHLASFDLVEHLRRQREFSAKAFGPHPRLRGVLAHIRKELEEIEDDEFNLGEWVDVVLLALDGAWRAGHGPEAIAAGIAAKQAKNEARTWPDWRLVDPDSAIEHDRSGEVTPTLEEAIAENMAASPYVNPPFADAPLGDRIAKAIERVTSGSGLMRVPAEATDPDLVLVACRERIAELERLYESLEQERDALAKMYADAVVIRDAALDALELMQRALASTMPGVRHIAVQDYAILNDAPVAAAKVLREAGRSTPSGT